jgi:hypothetical protein
MQRSLGYTPPGFLRVATGETIYTTELHGCLYAPTKCIADISVHHKNGLLRDQALFMLLIGEGS